MYKMSVAVDYWESWVVEIDSHNIPDLGDEGGRFSAGCMVFSVEEYESQEATSRWETIEFEVDEYGQMQVASAPADMLPARNIGYRIAD